MSLTEEISALLPVGPGREPLMTHASLEWTKEFGGKARAYIVIWTDRNLTTDGGDGWHGFDGDDMDRVDKALEAYVAEQGAFMVHGFIIRQKRGILPSSLE